MRPTRALRNSLFTTLLLAGLACCPQTTVETVRPTLAFSRSQVDFIMYRRDQGDGLADIARVIGATRPEVRLAERAEKARLYQVRR